MNQSIRSTGPRSLVGLLAVLLMIGLFAGPALAQHGTAGPAVTPTVQDFPGGPPNCPDGTGFRFGGDPEDAAPLSDGASAGGVTITLNPDKTVVGFETDGSVLVAHVFVKGGEEGRNWYNYTSFAGGGVAHDDGLTTPTNQEISHVDVCVVSAPPTDAPPTDAPPTDAPPTDAPPTDAPPTDAPPTDAPPTEAPTPPDTGTAAIDPTSGSGSRDAAFIMLLVATMAGAGLLIRALSRREPRSL